MSIYLAGPRKLGSSVAGRLAAVLGERLMRSLMDSLSSKAPQVAALALDNLAKNAVTLEAGERIKAEAAARAQQMRDAAAAVLRSVSSKRIGDTAVDTARPLDVHAARLRCAAALFPALISLSKALIDLECVDARPRGKEYDGKENPLHAERTVGESPDDDLPLTAQYVGQLRRLHSELVELPRLLVAGRLSIAELTRIVGEAVKCVEGIHSHVGGMAKQILVVDKGNGKKGDFIHYAHAGLGDVLRNLNQVVQAASVIAGPCILRRPVFPGRRIGTVKD